MAQRVSCSGHVLAASSVSVSSARHKGNPSPHVTVSEERHRLLSACPLQDTKATPSPHVTVSEVRHRFLCQRVLCKTQRQHRHHTSLCQGCVTASSVSVSSARHKGYTVTTRHCVRGASPLPLSACPLQDTKATPSPHVSVSEERHRLLSACPLQDTKATPSPHVTVSEVRHRFL